MSGIVIAADVAAVAAAMLLLSWLFCWPKRAIKCCIASIAAAAISHGPYTENYYLKGWQLIRKNSKKRSLTEIIFTHCTRHV